MFKFIMNLFKKIDISDLDINQISIDEICNSYFQSNISDDIHYQIIDESADKKAKERNDYITRYKVRGKELVPKEKIIKLIEGLNGKWIIFISKDNNILKFFCKQQQVELFDFK